jgi:ADP-ribosyl-[dinitrogen reductase] hydrolase
MPSPISLQDRVLGCLLGGALGDAWGGPHEGATASLSFEIPLRSSLSDDTQLTLATCESILGRGTIDAEHLASHFLTWFREGRIRGIGASTLKAMRDLAAGAHWALAGCRGQRAAGNGAAMRIAPLAFLVDPANPVDRTTIRDVCRITHHNDEAYVGALAVVLGIRAVLAGKWSQEHSFLASVLGSLPDSAVRDRIKELLPLQVSVSEAAARFGATGYVVDAVPLALYAAQFISTQPLEDVLSQTISAGGDTDTIASITGQLAGCVTGPAGISNERFDKVEGGDEVLRVSRQFAEFAARRSLKEST